MISRTWEALPALVILFLGLLLVMTVRSDGLNSAIIVVVISITCGVAASAIGRRVLLPDHPRWAVAAITTGSILAVGAAAAAATAAISYGKVAFDPDQAGVLGLDASLLKAFWAGLSAFLTLVFVKIADSADLFGNTIKSAFHAMFIDTRSRDDVPADRYPMVGGESELEPWIFQDVVDGVRGWGWRARWKRAENVSKLIREEAERNLVAAYRGKPAQESAAGKHARATDLANKPADDQARDGDASTLDASDS